MSNKVSEEFILQSIHHLEANNPRIKACLSELTDAEIWQSSKLNSNSIGNLVLHLCGNITQYVISCLGQEPDTRERDLEFSTKGSYSGSELYNKLSAIVSEAVNVIRQLSENNLTHIYSVQGFNLSGIGIIIHVTEHYSYHTGQIVFRTKEIKNKDMGFYAHIDLNQKNL
ncbi:MAG: DinB family protein [Ginsengibacter sp.]